MVFHNFIRNSPGLTRNFVGTRLFRGIGANVYGQAVALLIQFGSVPLLLTAWDAETFGLWLVISAIPSYLALADFGFSTAAANDMTLAVARGARAEARGVFQSVLALNVLVAAGLVAIVLVVVLFIPTQFLPKTAHIGDAEVRLVWILQSIQVVVTLSCGAFAGGFQSSGNYSLGVFFGGTARLLESLALLAGAFLFQGFVPAAAMMLTTRLAVLACMATVLLRVAPWLSLGIHHASVADIRRLSRSALAVVALPAAFAVSLQGFVLVIGATLSLDAVAAFSTIRTMTRMVIQAAGIVNHAIMPEVTRAFAEGDLTRLRRLFRINLLSVVSINAVSFALIAVFGTWFIALWTRDTIQPFPLMVIGLAVVASLHSFWLCQSNLILAINRHGSYSYWFLLVCVISVIAAIPMAKMLGVNGLLLPLLSGEFVMVLIVASAFRRTFGGVLLFGIHPNLPG